jgi:hypothetical protein
MAKPLYVCAFEHFKNNNEDTLKAFVAFGLFIEAEQKWAASQENWPTEAKYKHYHDCTLPHQAHNYQSGAEDVLVQFANGIVEQERREFLQMALDQFKQEAAKSHHGFWRGVLEATSGAFVWSVLLIVAAIIAGRLGIDVLGAFERAAGAPHPASTSAPP